jgi:hypothetical protein
MTPHPAPNAVSPLLTPALCGSPELGAAFARFPEAFLVHHEGYSRVRPALLPLKVSRRLAETIWSATAAVLARLRTIVDRRLADDRGDWIGTLGYFEDERRWLQSMIDPRSLEIATLFARADFVLGADGPRLVEVNVGPTVGGIGVLDRYSDLLESTCRELNGEALAEGISLPRPAALWAHALRRLSPAHRGAGEPVRVALVIADEEADIPHPHEAAFYLRREGLAADIVGVDGLRFHGAGAETSAGPVDIVYGCFTFDQLRVPAYRRFVERAMANSRAGGPVYVAPPVFTLFGNKSLLACLGEGTWQGKPDLLLTTRRLEPRLYDFGLKERTGQVLKPSVGYGGQGVVIGAECTPAVWKLAIEDALATDAVYVLQDYVAPVPIAMPDTEAANPYEFGIGCLSLGGRLGGLLLRQVPASRQGITNCKQGASFSAGCVADDDHVFPRAEAPRPAFQPVRPEGG